jgi:hypothetical protein
MFFTYLQNEKFTEDIWNGDVGGFGHMKISGIVILEVLALEDIWNCDIGGFGL